MERLRFRSTSQLDLLAELRQQELRAEAARQHRTASVRHGRSMLGLDLPWPHRHHDPVRR